MCVPARSSLSHSVLTVLTHHTSPTHQQQDEHRRYDAHPLFLQRVLDLPAAAGSPRRHTGSRWHAAEPGCRVSPSPKLSRQKLVLDLVCLSPLVFLSEVGGGSSRFRSHPSSYWERPMMGTLRVMCRVSGPGPCGRHPLETRLLVAQRPEISPLPLGTFQSK